MSATPRPLQTDGAFQKTHGSSTDGHSIAAILAPQLPAPWRDLKRVQLLFSEPFRPVGNQGAVRAAGYRIFRHAFSRSEKSRDEINLLSGRGYDGGESVD